MFELHVTFDCMDYPRFNGILNALRVEGLFVENLTGDHKHQMLLSYRNESYKKISEMMASAKILSKSTGIPILRNKIEIPFDAIEKFKYDEFHVKLFSPRSKDQQILKFCEDNCLACGWDLNQSDEKNRKWFITSRDHNQLPNVEKVFKSMINKIQTTFGTHFIGSIMETCVFDDNPGLDKGWLEE